MGPASACSVTYSGGHKRQELVVDLDVHHSMQAHLASSVRDLVGLREITVPKLTYLHLVLPA